MKFSNKEITHRSIFEKRWDFYAFFRALISVLLLIPVMASTCL